MFLRSSAERRATELREALREKVARNEVRASPLWARPCRAYNVHIELDPHTKASLGKTQQALKRAEPDLLACPRKTLHVSLAWLVAVHASYPVAKDSLWERHAEEWMAELARIAAGSTPFRITYEHVVATDSAVIALAEPADLVHTTLFRYRGALSDSEKFLAMLEDTSAGATAEVEELVVSKELVYPSLEAEVLGRLPLASR